MTIDSPHRLRKNSRARRNSVVQRIALSSHHGEDHIDLDSPFKGSLKRTKSFDSTRNRPVQKEEANDLLFPYTEAEKHKLLSNLLSTFDYDIFPSPEEVQKFNYAKNLPYNKFLEACQFRKHIYEDLSKKSTDIVKDLKDLTIKYDTVIKETYEFQSQADELIDEKTKYEYLNKEIKEDLHYYELLYTFTQKLNNPNPNMVRRDSFRTMLSQLDQCIAFIKDHPGHKESETYSRRFRQCLTRSLTLVRNYVLNNLKSIRDEITSKVNDIKIGSITHEALLYTKFGSDLESLQPLCEELCKRAVDDDEYEGLLNDCYNFYFGIRARLLQSKIQEQIQLSDSDKKSLVELIQRNLSFFTKIYKDEYELFYKVFTKNNKNQFNQWLQNISEPLYDTLRNSILHEQSITSLCESATLLEKYYEYEEEDNPLYDIEQENETREKTHLFEKEINLGEVFEPISQDIQSRLVFRAHAYVDENIVRFKPDSKTFQIGHKKSSKPTTTEQSSDEDFTTSNTQLRNNADALDNWYPPLKKGVTLLSKIYQLVSSQIFDDIAHSIVHDCIISMRQGHDVCQRSLGKLDSSLYFLKNLLMLQQQVQSFDIKHVSSETFLDFSGVGDIIGRFRNGASFFNAAGFLELVRESVPKVVNNMIDARVELQIELRNIVHTFTEDAVNEIIEPVVNYKTESLDQDVLKLQENIEEAFPRIKKDIELFIQDRLVVTTLIDGMQELVIQSYEKFYNDISSSGADTRDLLDVEALIGLIGEVVSDMFKAEVDELQDSESLVMHRTGTGDETQDDEDLNVSE